jgi:hypothetical protein
MKRIRTKILFRDKVAAINTQLTISDIEKPEDEIFRLFYVKDISCIPKVSTVP